MALGLLGKKIGMTQINEGADARVPVTLLEVGPCLVLQKMTQEKDGYTALKVGFGEAREKTTSKAIRGIYGKLQQAPRKYMREFRVDADVLGKYEVGSEISVADLFQDGQYVDVSGRTKGRGFTGVFKRWNFAGNKRTHGTHEIFRGPGSAGSNTWPAHIIKNKKMPGHYGDENVTTLNLRIVKVIPEKNCVAVEGAVPGANQGLVEVRPAIKLKKSL